MISNFKFQISNFKLRSGFTLIELLVVVGILSVIGSIVTGVITFSIRGTNKTNTIENLRQSGNYTISQMSKTIEFAESFDGLSNDGAIYDKACPVDGSPPTTTPYNRIKTTRNTRVKR
jgi:prepilin-type N-terminal cleavage/methylation domain-containing protein